MINKKILILVSLLLISFLLVGCDIWTIPVIENEAPVIISMPFTKATVGVKYTYDVDATDENDDALTHSLTTKPDGMVINFTTGVVTWIPVYGQVGGNDVTVVVTDGVKSDTQKFIVTVKERIPMTITVDSPLTFRVGEPYWFKVEIVANSDVGKSVVASFGVPTSTGGVEITGILETDVGSDLTFALVDNVFQTDPFTMEDATANFRGTFDEAGTYLTTLKVKTTSGKTLCSRSFTIVVEGLEVVPLVVGDSYGGGIVAYILQEGESNGVYDYVEGETHGLIAATADQSDGICWHSRPYGLIIGATETALGTGKANTALIISSYEDENNAAKVCDDYTNENYSDWFLPSKDELEKLRTNRDTIGGFTAKYGDYWSSSEIDRQSAWSWIFEPGDTCDCESTKEAAYAVRAVRYF